MISVFNPIAVVQLPQHHQAMSRKCTEGFYFMSYSQSVLIAAQMSLILKECFLFEISKKKVWLERIKDEC